MPQAVRAKLTEWTQRYLPLEIVGTVTALLGAWLANMFTANPVAIAFAGTWGENVGYYALAAARDFELRLDDDGDIDEVPKLGLWRLLRNMVVEFGFAEGMDSFVVRPACMYFGQQLLGSLSWGIVAGKLAADVVFYALVIVFYELRKKYLD